MKMNKNRVDPELMAALEFIEEATGGEFRLDDIPAARQALYKFYEITRKQIPDIEGVTTEIRKIPGPQGEPHVEVRIFQPENRAEVLPALLWIHGGGYVMGSAEQDELQTQYFAKTLQCVVVSVDYRLAPETPYPGPLEDCYASLKWLYNNCSELGVDQSRIAIGGASAGGGLTAGLALLVRDRGEMNIIYQLLIFPMIDDKNIHPPSADYPDTFIWSRGNNLTGWRSYLGQEPGGDKVPFYAAPFRAADVSGLPPAYVMVGGLDLFLDENIEYAQRLMSAGIPTELHVIPGVYHGFYGNAPQATVSKQFTAERDAILKRVLHG
jgi:acetyl esterase/lipase